MLRESEESEAMVGIGGTERLNLIGRSGGERDFNDENSDREKRVSSYEKVGELEGGGQVADDRGGDEDELQFLHFGGRRWVELMAFYN